MTDVHVHIGQFNEKYYDAHAIFEAIEHTASQYGIDCIQYSSTSSCRYDVELSRIEEEIAAAQSYKSSIIKTKPYLMLMIKKVALILYHRHCKTL